MRKFVTFLFIYILTFSNLSGEGIKGVYSCSSGSNNDKPVTYIFNQKLMVRDNNKEFPYEYVSSFKSGELMYVGYQKTDGYTEALKEYGARKDFLEHWISEIIFYKFKYSADSSDSLQRRSLIDIKSKNDFLFVTALGCEVIRSRIEKSIFYNNESYYGALYKSLFELDKSENKFFSSLPDKYRCDVTDNFLKSLNIDKVSPIFLDQNRKRALQDNVLYKKKLITIDLIKQTIWETKIGSTEKGKKYNCSTIDLEVPEIKEAENSILDETT
tara:strand:- start:427 stop:1239 length:813 start_codon:yes stop_codon:yes gene_type:complete